MWWFEVFELVRKFLLIGAPILLGYVMADADKAEIVYGLLTTTLTSAVHALGSPYLAPQHALLMLPSQLCVFLTLIAGMMLELVGDQAQDLASVMVLATAVPTTGLLLFAVIFPRTVDMWALRRKHKDLVSAVDALPEGSYPPDLTKADVALIVGTMSRRSLATVLEHPGGLEAELGGVFSDGSEKVPGDKPVPATHVNDGRARNAEPDAVSQMSTKPNTKKWLL